MSRDASRLTHRRPTEIASASGAGFVGIMYGLGASRTAVGIAGAISAVAPAVWRWTVENGGIRGTVRTLVYGKEA